MRESKKISVGGVLLGGGERVKIQSMTTTKTADVEKTVAQILALEKAGCEIVRVAISDEADALAVRSVVDKIHAPLVADIHFSPKLAVMAIENGANKVRINPGNIGGEKEIKFVADCVKAHKIPVRVGSNTGSIEKNFLEKYGRSAEALVESALFNVGILEKFGVNDIVISVKASDVKLTVNAYMLLANRTSYPLHLGVTEAGTTQRDVVREGVVQISVTFRVSKKWLNKFSAYKKLASITVGYLDTATSNIVTTQMYIDGYQVKLVSDTSYGSLWEVSFMLKEF